MSFGFWHLGRFSGAYATLFGCAPTETRRRVWDEDQDEAFKSPDGSSARAGAEQRESRDRRAVRVTPW
jgi:hypothetical protein